MSYAVKPASISTQSFLCDNKTPVNKLCTKSCLLMPQTCGRYVFSQKYCKKKDQAASVFFQVFGRQSRLPLPVREIISEYLSNEMGQLGLDKQPLLAPYVNLKDQATFMQLLGEPFRTTKHAKKAWEFVEPIFEKHFEETAQGKKDFDVIYPIQQELLSMLMRWVRGRKVLEIACANGLLGILLGYADAREVVLNDSNPLEERRFNTLLADVPAQIKKKFHYIRGNFFELKPECIKDIDVLYCGHMIHSFTAARMDAFFNTMNHILKENAIAIITVSAPYQNPNFRSIVDANPDCTAFKIVTVYNCSNHEKNLCLVCLLPDSTPIELRIRHKQIVYVKALGAKWKEDNTAFNRLDRAVQNAIKQGFSIIKEHMLQMVAGSIEVEVCVLTLYTFKTLGDLFESRNYEILSLQGVDARGHLVAQGEEWGNAHGVTIICRKKSAPSLMDGIEKNKEITAGLLKKAVMEQPT